MLHWSYNWQDSNTRLGRINKCGSTEQSHVVARIDREDAKGEKRAVARNGNKNFLPRGANRTRGFPRCEIRRRPGDKERPRGEMWRGNGKKKEEKGKGWWEEKGRGKKEDVKRAGAVREGEARTMWEKRKLIRSGSTLWRGPRPWEGIAGRVAFSSLNCNFI